MTTIGRAVFGTISVFMMLLAAGLIIFAGIQLASVFATPEPAIGRQLLDSVGYTIIAVAVFEVAKYIFEEEVLNPTEMRHTGEARRSMTKFVSTIAIAVFLEAIVTVFQTSKDTDVSNMLYPTFLLFGGVALIVGLGAYQRLSATAEKLVEGSPGEPTTEEDLKRPE
ncbi:MAG: GNAT family acetyltransferase [Propylenella sp.]